MANKALFPSALSLASVPAADTKNSFGGRAYKSAPSAALRQYAFTGTLNGTVRTSAETHLETALALMAKCDPEDIADIAIEARSEGHMKDMPALMVAFLAASKTDVARLQLKRAFPIVINNGKMLRNFVQMMRSGVLGVKSLGTTSKKLVQDYLNAATPERLLGDSIGNAPALRDIFKLAHPKPSDKIRGNIYSYLMDGKFDADLLPDSYKRFEAFKSGQSNEIPRVDVRLLEGLAVMTPAHWKSVALQMTWPQLRQSLNRLAGEGVFQDRAVVEHVAATLKNPELIRKAKAFPYQIYNTFVNTDGNIPAEIKNALYAAAEVATENVPVIAGRVKIAFDVSGSMKSPVTGDRKGSTSKMSCLDAGALFASAILRKNPNAELLIFSDRMHAVSVSGFDSVLTNTKKLSEIKGGGTNCSIPLAHLNNSNSPADVVIYISDYESWADNNQAGPGTGLATEWNKFLKKNPRAKLIAIDLTPRDNVQNTRTRALNVGGFSDAVFNAIAEFIRD